MNFNPKLLSEDFAIPAPIVITIICLIGILGGVMLWLAG